MATTIASIYRVIIMNPSGTTRANTLNSEPELTFINNTEHLGFIYDCCTVDHSSLLNFYILRLYLAFLLASSELLGPES